MPSLEHSNVSIIIIGPAPEDLILSGYDYTELGLKSWAHEETHVKSSRDQSSSLNPGWYEIGLKDYTFPFWSVKLDMPKAGCNNTLRFILWEFSHQMFTRTILPYYLKENHRSCWLPGSGLASGWHGIEFNMNLQLLMKHCCDQKSTM